MLDPESNWHQLYGRQHRIEKKKRQGLSYGISWFYWRKPNHLSKERGRFVSPSPSIPGSKASGLCLKKEMVWSFFHLQDVDLGVDQHSVSSTVSFSISLVFIYLLIWRHRERFNQTTGNHSLLTLRYHFVKEAKGHYYSHLVSYSHLSAWQQRSPSTCCRTVDVEGWVRGTLTWLSSLVLLLYVSTPLSFPAAILTL